MGIFDKLLGKRGNNGGIPPPPPAPSAPVAPTPPSSADIPNLTPDGIPPPPSPIDELEFPTENDSFDVPEIPEQPKDDFLSESLEAPQPIEEQIPEPSFDTVERVPLVEGKPLFIRVGDYREVLQGSANIKTHLKEADSIIQRANELKEEQEKEFDKWKGIVEDINRKMVYVDKVLFESG